MTELKEFENDLFDLVKNVKFKHHKSSTLQSTMKNHMKDMKRENKIYVAADKTTNYYKVTPEDHNEMLMNNITKEYKKSNETALEKVDKQDKNIANKLELDDRIYAFTKRESFITIKDHKDNFENNTKCRLINPAKSELGKVSKKIVARIATSLKEKTKLNLWKNTDSVLKWFKDFKKRTNYLLSNLI